MISLALAATLFAGGCAMLEPKLPAADAAIPGEWPLPPTTSAAPTPAAIADVSTTNVPSAAGAAAEIGWRDFFTDVNLEELIALALTNNRDLRVAVLNVEKARAQYRVQRADRMPSLGVNATMVRIGGDAPMTESYSVNLGVTEFELDLFGRVRNLSQAALESYFSQEEARRSAQLSLVAEVANVYLTLAADQEQLRLAQATMKTREESYALTEKRHDLGAVSALDLNQSRTLVEGARADAARYAGQVAQDSNSLSLWVGTPLPAELLPSDFGSQVSGLDALPAGLPSAVLLRRPDVLQAEHVLRAANANIGAARAAFFPSITLTGAVGSTSAELSGLFGNGTNIWSFVPQVNVPIFEGGRLRASLGAAKADRDIALARYEQSIQVGFREVDAATRAEGLARARYEAWRDSYLVRLESQRALYVAQQALITTRLAEQSNRVTLYKVLGGGWNEHGP